MVGPYRIFFRPRRKMFVIIPAKPFRHAKSRLTPILPAERRLHLSRGLLAQTINLARRVGPVAVISRDNKVRQLAQRRGAWSLVENEPGLNPAVSQAVTWAMMQGADSVLILPADLPLLRREDLTGLVTALPAAAQSAVICPCQRGDGTNALLLRPPALIEPAFGLDSFNRHLQQLQTAGVSPVIYQSDTLAFDLDLPADWEKLIHHVESIGSG